MKIVKKNFKIDDNDNLIVNHTMICENGAPLDVYIPKINLQRDFLVIRETLTRTGILDGDKLLQLCHILYKRGQYYIVHYKDLLALDGKRPKLEAMDISYREHITALLQKWGMINVIDEAARAYILDQLESAAVPDDKVAVIAHSMKENYELTPMYNIGNPKNRERE